ncbi:hypothetical protein T484DRAFT_1764061, partial [Baffinella frigidus]
MGAWRLQEQRLEAAINEIEEMRMQEEHAQHTLRTELERAALLVKQQSVANAELVEANARLGGEVSVRAEEVSAFEASGARLGQVVLASQKTLRASAAALEHAQHETGEGRRRLEGEAVARARLEGELLAGKRALRASTEEAQIALADRPGSHPEEAQVLTEDVERLTASGAEAEAELEEKSIQAEAELEEKSIQLTASGAVAEAELEEKSIQVQALRSDLAAARGE